MSQSVDPFLAFIQPVIALLEGGGTLTNNPDDAGGPTIWGITEATAREEGYTGAMADMTEAQAVAIYRTRFWTKPGFDQIYSILPELALYLLETGINLGPKVPSGFLQRALNVMNNQSTLYANVTVDGRAGALTRAALVGYRTARPVSQSGDLVLMGVMRSLAVVDYMQIAEANPTQETFEYGWVRDRALGLPS